MDTFRGSAKLVSLTLSNSQFIAAVGGDVQRGHLRQTPTVVGRNLTQSSEARSELAILRITSVFVCVSYPRECYIIYASSHQVVQAIAMLLP